LTSTTETTPLTDHQGVTGDYIGDPDHDTKFGENLSTGTLEQMDEI